MIANVRMVSPKVPLEYISGGGYQYAMADGRVIRVPRERPAVTTNPPKVGDSVTVIVKPYKDLNYVSGIVKRLLTKKKQHTRGFKVMLNTGVVGRMVG
jgi:uncharacterized repeat protein (TIGR03833 family)